MTFFIRRIIRGFGAPKHRLSCSTRLWKEGLTELRKRTEGVHESGAFLLGYEEEARRKITRFAYYDDFDPRSLDTGIVVFDGSGYGPLWQLCRTLYPLDPLPNPDLHAASTGPLFQRGALSTFCL